MAKFGVGGQWEAEIKLNGVSLALTPNTLKYLCVSSSVTKPMPTCTFTVVDQGADFLTNVGVADGMPLYISMDDAKGGPTFYGDFTVVGGPADAHYTTKGVMFTVNGMLNKMGYLRKVTNTVKKETSAGMITALANEAGINQVDVDRTSDKMAWLPNGLPIAKRIAEIASRGWASPQSAMVHVLNEDGTFKYKDLSKLATASAKAQFGSKYRDPGDHGPLIPVLQFRAMSLQGLYNNAAAYGATAFVEGLSGKTGFGVGDVLTLVDNGGTSEDIAGAIMSALQGNLGNFSTLMAGAGLNISPDIQKAVGNIGSKQFATPLSSGNCQVGGTLVPTKKGLLRLDAMADRRNGDEQDIDLTVGSLRRPRKAKKWFYSGEHHTLVVTTATGNKLQGTHAHPNLVLDENTGELVWKTTTDCKVGDLLCLNPRQPLRRSALRLNLKTVKPCRSSNNPALRPTVMTPDLAALLGYTVAEGGVTKHAVYFHNTSKVLVKRFIGLLHSVFGDALRANIHVDRRNTKKCYNVAIHSKALASYLIQLGCTTREEGEGDHPAYVKTVPWSVLQSDSVSQMAFTGAYIDGDGTIDNHTGRISVMSASRVLVEQMQVMLNAHGVFPILRENYSKVYNTYVQWLTLNGSDSTKLWPAVEPFVKIKSLRVKHRQNKSYGVPSAYWQALLKARKTNVGRNKAYYATDSGKVINVSWDWAAGDQIRVFRNSIFTYEDYASGKLNSLLYNLRRISPSAYRKLKDLLDRRYFFTPIVSIVDGGVQHVYDLSMGCEDEPAFIANGIVVHNTHANYQRAKVQNVRGRAAFGNDVVLLSNQACGLSNLDNIYYHCTNPWTGADIPMFSGDYIITAKDMIITMVGGKAGFGYFERVTVTNNGGGAQRPTS